MYLLIMEDDKLVTMESVTDDDLQTADDGYISIVNMEDNTEYFDGEWHEIEEAK